MFKNCLFGSNAPVGEVFQHPGIWIGEQMSAGCDGKKNGPATGEQVMVINVGARGLWVKFKGGVWGETDPSNVKLL